MNSAQRIRNALLVLVALFIAALLVVGCSVGDSEDDVESTDDGTTTATESTSAVNADVPAIESTAPRIGLAEAPPGLDACNVQQHVTAALDTIVRWPRQLFADADECVIAILDSLVDGYVATGDERYLEVLDTCRSYSDGYVSEYLMDAARSLFERRVAGFVRYLYLHREPAAPIGSSLVESWRAELARQDNGIRTRERLAAETASVMSAGGVGTDEKVYVEQLMTASGLVP